eukprot:GFYU01001031.1.p1 GENE.GFYU01001031.1~~GFYU01001031.1.p1  ORF type:complete len:525 (-),score=112.25 GFYU01001031.1:109-1683(-)
MVSVLRKRSSVALAAAETGDEPTFRPQAPAKSSALKTIIGASVGALALVGSVAYLSAPQRTVATAESRRLARALMGAPPPPPTPKGGLAPPPPPPACTHWSDGTSPAACCDFDANECQRPLTDNLVAVSCVPCVQPAPAPTTCTHWSNNAITAACCDGVAQCQRPATDQEVANSCVPCDPNPTPPTSCTHWSDGTTPAACCNSVNNSCQLPIGHPDVLTQCAACDPNPTPPTICHHFTEIAAAQLANTPLVTQPQYPCCDADNNQCQRAINDPLVSQSCVTCGAQTPDILWNTKTCAHFDTVRCPGETWMCCNPTEGMCQSYDGQSCDLCSTAVTHGTMQCDHYDPAVDATNPGGNFICCVNAGTCQNVAGDQCVNCDAPQPGGDPSFNQHLCCDPGLQALANCGPSETAVCCGHKAFPDDYANNAGSGFVESGIVCMDTALVDLNRLLGQDVCTAAGPPPGEFCAGLDQFRLTNALPPFVFIPNLTHDLFAVEAAPGTPIGAPPIDQADLNGLNWGEQFWCLA